MTIPTPVERAAIGWAADVEGHVIGLIVADEGPAIGCAQLSKGQRSAGLWSKP